jgi:hypothetical protein
MGKDDFERVLRAMTQHTADGQRIATKAEVWREWHAHEFVRAYRRLVEVGVIRLKDGA